jgi:MFS family permease
MWFFSIVYAVEGVCQAKSGIVWLPLTYFLKQTQGWDPVQVSVSLAVLDVPWIIKPLYGLVSDFIPLFGYRRRYYLLGANVAGIASFAAVGILSQPAALISALTVTSIAMAISSTQCGAILVETGHKLGGSARFVNQQWLWYNIAQMAAVLLGGGLLEFLPPLASLHTAAWVAAAAPLSILAAALLVPEDRTALNLQAFRSRARALLDAFRTPALWMVAGFLFLYYFSPGFGTPLYYQMTDRLGFSQAFIGLLSSVNAGGWIIGGVLYQWKLAALPTLVLLKLSILAGVVATLAYLVLFGPVSAVFIWLLGGISSMIATIATLSLAAEACPDGAEGFAFAGLMSIINLASPAADMIGSVLYERVFARSLTPLIVVSAAATALVCLLLPLATRGSGRRAGIPAAD